MNTKKKILIVDDSDGDHFIFGRILSRVLSDCELSSAYNGEQAIEMIKGASEPFDLIFLDINMPRINGLEVLAAVDADIPKQTSIFMLTTSVFDAERDESLSYDCVKEFLSKPLGMDRLKELVAQYLE